MAHSSPARWLAPAALVVACLALVLVLAGSLGSSSEPPAPDVTIPTTRSSTPARTATTAPTATATAPAKGAPAVYTVQAGDYLSTVAERTGVSVDRLRELNPGLDANSMHVGQKIQLEPSAP
jgi:LysM repeat protein